MDTSANDSLRDSLESAIAAQETPQEIPAEPTESSAIASEDARARDDKGRFAKSVENAPEPIEPEPAEETEHQPPARMSPRAWRKEVAEKYWNQLAPELQDEIERREMDVSKGFEQHRPKVQLADDFTQAIQPFMQTIQALGTTPVQAAQTLFAADHLLRNGSADQKAQMIQQILHDYQIDPQHLFNQIQQAPLDHNALAMQRYAQQMEQRYNSLLQAQQQREAEQLNSQIQEFAQDKEHFDAVREDMAALLQAGRASTLQDAYDMAIYANPTTRAAMLQQQNAQRQAQQQQSRATSAAVSLKGSSPVSGTANTPKGTLREELEAAFANIE